MSYNIGGFIGKVRVDFYDVEHSPLSRSKLPTKSCQGRTYRLTYIRYPEMNVQSRCLVHLVVVTLNNVDITIPFRAERSWTWQLPDGKWVILASGRGTPENSSSRQSLSSPTFQNSRSCTGLQLYRLVLPAHSNSVSASPPKLNFIRTLHDHTSTISAVADGRCISLGENGSIWVWDLEARSGAEVAAVDERLSEMGSHPVNGMIG